MSCPARSFSGPSCPNPVMRAIDEARIDAMQFLRTEAETLHDARPEPFDQHIGTRCDLAQQGNALRPFQIELHDVAAVAVEVVAFRADRGSRGHRPFRSTRSTLAPISASISPASGTGAEPRHLDHLEPGKRASRCFLSQDRLPYLGAMRMAPSMRIVSPFSIWFSTMWQASAPYSAGLAEARRERHLLAERILPRPGAGRRASAS